MLVDTHCHLNFYQPEEVEGILARAKENRVEKFVNIGTSMDDSELAVKQASTYPEVYATVGLHPNDNHEITVDNVDWDKLEKLAKLSKVVAIGECGLDYSSIQYSVSSIEYANEKERQRNLFIKQIEMAAKLNLPLSIHVRDAYEDMLQVASLIKTPTVFHCFSGTITYLNSLLNNPNFYFSFAGNVTFKNADNIRQLAQLVPIDKLLIETDCPFLTPEPFRGAKNEPANVRIVAEKLGEAKGLALDEVSKATSENAVKLFNL